MVLSAASLLLAVIAADGGVRLWDRVSGSPYSTGATETAIREIVTTMTSALPTTDAGIDPEVLDPRQTEGTPPRGKKAGRHLRYRLHPYTGFELDAGLRVTESTVTFFEKDDPDRPYVVFLQGGSVAALFGGTQQEGFRRLIERMRADPAFGGRKIKTVRLAVPGFKQPQQLMQLAYLLSRGCKPDMVLNLDGLNEVRIGSNNALRKLQPTWPSFGHWTSATTGTPDDDASLDLLLEMRSLQQEVQEEARTALGRRYAYSAILGKWTLSRLTRLRARWTKAQEAFVDHKANLGRQQKDHAFGMPPKGKDAVKESVRCWFESSLAMHQLCSARGIRYVHALQPTLHDEGSKPITDEERRKGIGEKGFNRAVVRGYPLLREGMAKLRELGVEALDLSLAFEDIEETVYFDTCHFEDLGCRALSDRMAEAMGVASLPGSPVGDER